ncbi:MAG: HNH endonuclease [Ralstonia sp.]|jgi:hypothetical protein
MKWAKVLNKDIAIRPIRIEGDVAYVPLTQGYEAVIDAVDIPLVAGFGWFAIVNGRTVYAARNVSLASGKRRMMGMHRMLMGDPTGVQIDHRDGNGLNNRKTNIRIATPAQNQHNQRRRRDNTSGLKGVTWHKASAKWQARVWSGGKRIYLGLFDTPEAAHDMYAEAVCRFHGEFGRLA